MVASLDVVCHVITCRYMCKLHGVIRHCAPRQLAAVFEVEIVKFSTKKINENQRARVRYSTNENHVFFITSGRYTAVVLSINSKAILDDCLPIFSV